jgi:hypothetical protein
MPIGNYSLDVDATFSVPAQPKPACTTQMGDLYNSCQNLGVRRNLIGAPEKEAFASLVREYNAHILFVPRTCREEFMT